MSIFVYPLSLSLNIKIKVKAEDAEAGEDEAEEGVMVKDEEDHLPEEEDVEVVDVVPEETGEEMVVISRVSFFFSTMGKAF